MLDFKTVFLFIRRVKYYLYLKIRFFLDDTNTIQSTRTKTQDMELIKNIAFIASIRLLVDFLSSKSDPNIIFDKTADILKHDFYLFGRKYSFLPDNLDTGNTYHNINWNYDPSSKIEFPQKEWYRYIRKSLQKGGDLKYPWELSRFQHLLVLGQAFSISGDEKYVLEFVNEVTDWIEHNPVRYGINWSCTMEVGIRIANWVISLGFFIDSEIINDEFLKIFYRSALEHGDHVYNNLENLQVYTSNHYAANISGLFILSLILPSTKQVRHWQKFSLKELEKEIINQTSDSGWQYEASTAYHRLVTEMFYYSYLVGKALGISFSDRYVSQLGKMIQVLKVVAMPGGKIPQIGDNDSGRFLVFDHSRNIDDLNINYLLKSAAAHRELGVNGNPSGNHFFQDAGRYLWKDKNLYLLLVAGPKGQGGNGGHAHNDVLSYVLNVDGREVFVDPGTYVYTRNPEDRNFFRSVKNHNTLHWDNLEPCTFDNGLFTLREEGSLEVSVNYEDEQQPVVTGSYSYADRWHKRSVSVDFIKRIIKITDKCSQHGGTLNLVLAPEMKFRIDNNGIENDLVKVTFDGVETIKKELGFYSSGYGKREETNVFRVKLKNTHCSHTISY